MSETTPIESRVRAAREQLDAHVREIVQWHFSPETGCPFWLDFEIFSKTLSEKTFPRGADWLMLGPSGPRRLRLAIEHLAQHRRDEHGGGGISFCVDLDPRWVIKLIKRGEVQEANLYKQHCIEQALTILRNHPNIKCIFTTPKLLE